LPTASPDRPKPTLLIALLGGESTGKSKLAAALHAALQARDVTSSLVQEHLRNWCEAHDRVPRAFEQAGLATAQGSQITTAIHAEPPVQVVIADTTPLMVATYSEIYVQDDTLLPAALAWQRQADLNLLMGLDLPWVADGLFRDSPAIRERTDGLLRQHLQSAGLPYHTVYGQGQARLDNALRLVEQALNTPLTPRDASTEAKPLAWACERCSDPDCERRLFSRLL
jgi:HTH-type transcriptional regulator, transcriptional repressor of NAD biosynthesis genes